jgi:hypothetical protein
MIAINLHRFMCENVKKKDSQKLWNWKKQNQISKVILVANNFFFLQLFKKFFFIPWSYVLYINTDVEK